MKKRTRTFAVTDIRAGTAQRPPAQLLPIDHFLRPQPVDAGPESTVIQPKKRGTESEPRQ